MVPPKIKNISSKYSENILCTFKPTNMKKEELTQGCFTCRYLP